MIETICLNEGWTLSRDGFDEEVVNLPHSWNGQDGQAGAMWKGVGQYRRTFFVDEQMLKRPLFLEVNGAAMTSAVSVNGVEIHRDDCPYSMYRVRLNGCVNAGENTVCITADNTPSEKIYPQTADFSFYGGVYRDVNLVLGTPLGFDVLDQSRDGVRLFAQMENGGWLLRATGTLVSELACAQAEVCCRVLSRQGDVAAKQTQTVLLSPQTPFAMELRLDAPHLWQGVEDPYLYTVELSVSAQGRLWDARQIPFGFRTLTLDAEQGVFLNGRPIKLKGVARHQDFGGVGPYGPGHGADFGAGRQYGAPFPLPARRLFLPPV